MQGRPQDKNFHISRDQLLGSLVRELKNPLILIARQAELEKLSEKTDSALESIQDTADKTLQLIDSYLLAAQAEYGQHSLPLQTMGVGSVIYEVAEDLRTYAQERKVKLVTDISDGNVMANREGLRAVIWCLAELVVAQTSAYRGKRQKEIRIVTKRSRETVSVAVLGSQVEITNSDMNRALKMNGAYLAGGKLTDSGIRLAIADILINSLGSRLQVRKINGLKGLNFELSISKQLSLV